jgi:hypothetical protein
MSGRERKPDECQHGMERVNCAYCNNRSERDQERARIDPVRWCIHGGRAYCRYSWCHRYE